MDIMDENELIIPQQITRLAFCSIPCMLQCMMICYIHEYFFLLSCLWCLLGTSIMYWNNTTNRFIYNVDRGFAISALGIKSHIANDGFNPIGKKIWYSSLLITGIAYILSVYLFEQKKRERLIHKNDITHINYMRRSVYYHMFFIHFMPTTTFTVCVLYYKSNTE
jgi:hypothetical protein